MAGIMDDMAMVRQARKIGKKLASEIVEVEAGDGAIVIQFSCEPKIVDVKVKPELINLDNPTELEGWIKAAVRDGLKTAQEVAAENMRPLMGGRLGDLMGK